MQVAGVSCFIIAANSAGHLVGRYGAEKLIYFGTSMALLSALLLFAYGLNGGTNPRLLAVLFVPMNVGLGLRGPPGFLRAVMAGQGDDDRAASLLILTIAAVAALGTAVAAPLVTQGLAALCTVVVVIQLVGLAALFALPTLKVG